MAILFLRIFDVVLIQRNDETYKPSRNLKTTTDTYRDSRSVRQRRVVFKLQKKVKLKTKKLKLKKIKLQL